MHRWQGRRKGSFLPSWDQVIPLPGVTCLLWESTLPYSPLVLAPLPGRCVQVMNQFGVAQVQHMLLHFFFFSGFACCVTLQMTSHVGDRCFSTCYVLSLLQASCTVTARQRLPHSCCSGQQPLCSSVPHSLPCLPFTDSCSANTAFIKKSCFSYSKVHLDRNLANMTIQSEVIFYQFILFPVLSEQPSG